MKTVLIAVLLVAAFLALPVGAAANNDPYVSDLPTMAPIAFTG